MQLIYVVYVTKPWWMEDGVVGTGNRKLTKCWHTRRYGNFINLQNFGICINWLNGVLCVYCHFPISRQFNVGPESVDLWGVYGVRFLYLSRLKFPCAEKYFYFLKNKNWENIQKCVLMILSGWDVVVIISCVETVSFSVVAIFLHYSWWCQSRWT
jgi:hypothetical protein